MEVLAITASPEQCRHLSVDSAVVRSFLEKLDKEGEVYGPKAVLHLALQPQVCGLEIRGELPIRGEFPPEFEPHETEDMPVDKEGHAEEYDLRRKSFVCRWRLFPRATRSRMLLELFDAIVRAHRARLKVQRGSSPGPYWTKVDSAVFQLLKRFYASKIQWCMDLDDNAATSAQPTHASIPATRS